MYSNHDQNKKYNHSLKSLCNHSQYLITNCTRDYNLAKSFGFSGRLIGFFQGMGAYPIDEMQSFKSGYSVDKRKIIAGPESTTKPSDNN